MIMFDKLDAVVERFQEVNEKLADPSIYERQAEFKQLNTERSHLEEIVNVYKEYKQTKENIEEAKEILKNENDEDMRDVAKKNSVRVKN